MLHVTPDLVRLSLISKNPFLHTKKNFAGLMELPAGSQLLVAMNVTNVRLTDNFLESML